MDSGQRFRDSQDYEHLRPYADSENLIAGHRVEGLLARDPWRHTTYEAVAPDGRPVALKLLRSNDSRREMKLFCQRTRARAAIEHPHLVPIFDWGRLGDHLYVVMGLCKAPTLADLLEAGPLKPKGCLLLLGQLADALETAHGRGVIHCDLAPENVLVTARGGGHVLLGDFGVTRDRAGGPHELAERRSYVSPEELTGGSVTPASNVYSLGCILEDCLLRNPRHRSEQPGVVTHGGDLPGLSQRRPEPPTGLDDVVAIAMAADPDERLQSPRKVLVAAAAALGMDSPVPVVRGDQVAAANGLPANASRDGGAAAGHKAAARATAVPRAALTLAFVVVAVLGGVGGLVLARSAHDERATERATPADTARLRAARERTNAFRATDLALERLDGRRASARGRLAAARTRRGQAAAASELSSAYRAAARVEPKGSPDTTRIASILNDVAQAYDRLSRSSRRGGRRSYGVARRAVRRREAGLQQAILRLNRTRR